MTLDETSSVIYVGARGHVYRLHADNITQYEKSPVLESAPGSVAICTPRREFVEEFHCRNHIRYIFEVSDVIEVCGTGAYKPRTFQLNKTDLSIIKSGGRTSGHVKCPYGPDHNSTAIFIETGNPSNASAIYSATFEDIPASEPVIYRPSVGDSPYLRSVKNDRYVFMSMSQLRL
ncbi:hypothetical protein NP493_960g02029 [Ridgeia piscesae]|uniref:Sema domain-containing protein n=1 Tax=Ridgeia piscesae TaxID=27915 RepID=A0AAD9NL99_RIDPI|nr:hypothetical protein NP493_960g02029 [Ridgeia piscesae]